MAVVAYDRYGAQGMWQLGTRNMIRQNVVAIDVGSGRHLWTARIAEDNFADARVVAANQDYAYVANAEGLHILAMDSGRTVAAPGEVAGLDDLSAGAGRFVYDASTDRILAQTTNGIAQLRLGETSATPATEEDGYAWTPPLGDEHHDLVATFATYDEAAVGETLVEIHDDRLTVQGPGGEARQLTGRPFDDGELVVNRAPPVRATQQFRAEAVEPQPLIGSDIYDAVGGAGGYVVVSETTYGRGAQTRLTTVSLDTGQALDTIAVRPAPTGGSTSPTGASVITLQERFMGTSPVVLVSPDGQFSTSVIGRADFFGRAL